MAMALAAWNTDRYLQAAARSAWDVGTTPGPLPGSLEALGEDVSATLARLQDPLAALAALDALEVDEALAHIAFLAHRVNELAQLVDVYTAPRGG